MVASGKTHECASTTLGTYVDAESFHKWFGDASSFQPSKPSLLVAGKFRVNIDPLQQETR